MLSDSKNWFIIIATPCNYYISYWLSTLQQLHAHYDVMLISDNSGETPKKKKKSELIFKYFNYFKQEF